MLRITLRWRPDRESLLAFWLAFSLVSGLIVGAVAWAVSGGLVAVLVFLAATPAAAAWGIAKPRIAAAPYSYWNRLARKYAVIAQVIVMRICYWTALLFVRGDGRALKIQGDPESHSLWVERGTLEPGAYGSLSSDFSGPPRNGWFGETAAWTLRSGQSWMALLLPYLGIVRALDVRKEKKAPSGIYTLY